MAPAPDNTAVRVALWRALHVEIDPPPHVLVDEIGLELAAPDAGWQQRRDMDPRWTSRNRASIVARARFVEDLVAERADAAVAQYVILGAGLDTFALRHPDLAARLRIFEIDEPPTQEWKQRRLAELGYEIPGSLRFVPVDFEGAMAWNEQLVVAGLDSSQPTVVSSTGVSVYLTREAILDTLAEVASFVGGSSLAMSFMVPLEMVSAEEQRSLQGAAKGARAGGTPWISFFTPEEIVELARDAGFREVRHVSAVELTDRYFADRSDGLRPSSAEELIVAST